MQNLHDELEEVLRSDQSLISDGKLLKNVVIERAAKLEPEFIRLLMASESTRRHFFTEVDGVFVFDKERFRAFVANKAFLPDSYTSFKNRIGLSTGRESYVKESQHVVLAWPYKDCVLEGGQSKEEENRAEVFWNTTLAPDDITRLLEPKAFRGFERWDPEAVKAAEPKPVDQITNSDNLLIKGNNLLALHSLKPKYAGRVKLVYIDPPYNTENGTFRYNDKFNHSTWLTFMKNRLEIARDLLSPDGSIYVNIDHNEAHYLKVLMDEVFGRENFQREIIWRIGWVSGHKYHVENFVRNHDTILYYARNSDQVLFNKLYIDQSDFKRFKKQDLQKLVAFIVDMGISKQEAKKIAEEAKVIGLTDRYPLEDTWNCSLYDDLNSVAVVSFAGETVSKMLGVEAVKGQKAEALLQRIIESSTQEGDLVLDFFAGTGTTCAVAQKLNRQWIGIEQLDYIEETTKERLKRVLSGDRVGISTAVDWQGGGEFVYAELAEWNQTLLKRIHQADSSADLLGIVEALRTHGYLRPGMRVDLLGERDFLQLPMDEQQAILQECLDLNHLYVNVGDMSDEAYGLSASDLTVNRGFYEVTA